MTLICMTLLEYSIDHGARGVLLNCDTADPISAIPFVTSNSNDEEHIGYGGPIDKNNITVIHDCRDVSSESDFTCLAERIFITEYNNARRTFAQLSSKAIALVKLYRVAAQKARSKFLQCKSVAKFYANRAKDTITSSLRGAFTSTQRVVHQVSRGNDSRIFQSLSDRFYSLQNDFDIIRSTMSSPERYHESSSSCEECSEFASHTIDSNQSNPSRISLDKSIISNEPCSACESMKRSNNRTISNPILMPQPIDHRVGMDHDDQTMEDDNESTPTKTSIRVVKGYAKWSSCQLDGEIRREIWHVLPLRHDYVFPEKLDRTSWWSKLYNIARNQAASSKRYDSMAASSTAASTSSDSNSIHIAGDYSKDVETNSFFDEFTLSINDIMSAISIGR